LNRVDQAEKVLREGIRNNPKNYELLYEMGRLYQDNQHNLERARNIWRYAFKCWFEQGEEGRETTGFFGSRIACSLGELEKEAGNLPQAIRYFELAKPYSPKPEGPQKQIEELRGKLKTP
jgi:tetratricopeptide (TPR) repeat protein